MMEIFNNLFSKIMAGYLIFLLLILVVLSIALPEYLKNYFFKSKEEELFEKSKLAKRVVMKGGDRNNDLEDLEALLDTSIIIFDQESNIINQGHRMMGMMSRGGMHMMHSSMGSMHPQMSQGIAAEMMDFSEELDKVLAGERRSFHGETPMLNQAIIGVGIPINSHRKKALFLISPLRGLQETVKKVRNLTLKVVLVAIIIALVLGYFISQGITRPLKDIKKKAKLMAQGNFKLKINQNSDDEIGELAASFNYLSTKLEHNINELTTEKRRMEEMLSSMAEGVLGVGTKNKILIANDRLKEIFNINDKIIGEGINNYFDDNLIEFINNIAKDNNEDKLEFEWKNKIILAHGAPIQVQEKELWGSIILIRDVTEIRRLDQMRRLFVANTSHELKTPLTAIRGYLEAILDGLVEDVGLQTDYLKRVLAETNRMTNLVHDILNLSRLQSGQFEFETKEFDLVAVVKLIFNNLESNFVNRDVRIIAPDQVIVVSDKSRIEEVIINLVTNALKFSSAEDKVEVIIEELEDRVKLSVKDNGIGIPDDELNHIWERFHQVDRARTPGQEGTGLGLAIVKEIIEGLGGEIGVKSSLGEGSEFYFIIK